MPSFKTTWTLPAGVSPSVVVPGSTVVSKFVAVGPPGQPGSPLGSPLEGTTLSLYGTSYDVSPGFKCTAGQEWFARMKTRLALAAVNTYAVSSNWIHLMAFQILGTGAGSLGMPAFVAGSQWLPSRKGFAIIDTDTNDSANILDLTAVTATAFTANDLNQRVSGMRAACSLISAGTRTEIETGTLTGTWSTLTDTPYSGGSLRYTSTAGDHATITVTFPAAGYVDVIVMAIDPAVATAAAINVSVDGGAQPADSMTSAQLSMRGYKAASGSAQFIVPARIRVHAAAGSHTITLTHAGTTGQYIYADVIAIPSATPSPIFITQDYQLVGGLGTSPAWTTGQAATIAANRLQLAAAYQAVAADYPNAVWVPDDGTFTASTMASAVDGDHPNDLGMKKIADQRTPVIATWARTATTAQLANLPTTV